MFGTILEYLPIVVGIAIGLGYPIAFVVKAIRSDPTVAEDAGEDAGGTSGETSGTSGETSGTSSGTSVAAIKALASKAVAGKAATTKAAATDRVALIDAFLVSVLALLFAWLWVPWQVVPPAVWAMLVGLVAYGALRAVPALRAGPWATGPHPGRKLASTAVGAVAVVAVFVAVVV